VTTDSIFHGSHLSLRQLSSFLVLWSQNASLKLISHECDIKSYKTLVSWSRTLRELIYEYLTITAEPLGGIDKVVEIDESLFGRRKFNRGKRVNGQWIFGMIERESGRVVLVPVANRTRDTLLPIIKKWILPGTLIISDCWKPYDVLSEEDFKHLKVNHSLHFKDPDTGANTNRIEATWRAAKSYYNTSGRRKSFYGGYLAKYSFFKQCEMAGKDKFTELLKCISLIYKKGTEAVENLMLEEKEDDSDLSDDE
jgi:transposase-like protein